MARILSYLLFGFAVATLIMAIEVFRGRVKGREEDYLLSGFCLGSTLWSFCFGMILIQTDVGAAYLLRCVGMTGTFAYLIFATLILVEWSEIEKPYIRVLKYFPMTAIVLYPFLMKPSNTIFIPSAQGMNYTFSKGIWNELYNVYCVLVAVDMIYLVVCMIRNKKRKSIRVLGMRLLLCELVILMGMVFDTFLPMFGLQAIPGSTITQFFGALLLYQAYQFYRCNSITLSNMSEFVYYSVETPVLIYDEEKKLRIVNKSAVEFFSLPMQYEQIGLSKLFALDEGVLHSGIVQLKVDTHCLKNNAYCRLVINRIPDRYNEVLGYIIIVDDLTDKMQIIEELKEARKHADRANRAKSRFLAQMSHEIRTPLNTVLGMDEMILRESESQRIREHAGYIRSAGKTLLGIINDILDLSKMESGKIQLMEDKYSLRVMLHDTLNIISLKQKEKGLALELDIAEDIPDSLYGDELRLKQAVTNILNNAVKYTEKGKVSLGLHWRETSLGLAELTFRIEDTGRGIRKEDMKKLFAPYERFEERQNRMIEGSGLGLAITKELLELMGGRMEVESEYGKGSVFTLIFSQKIIGREPIGKISEREEWELPEQEKERSRECLVAPDVRVLVVDDIISNLVIIQGLLRRTRIKVDMAKSGRDALRMVAKKEYRIIFLDHMMPEMDGIETLQEIRKLEGNPNAKTPVVALTANAVLGAKERYLAAGFDDYLSKPVDALLLEKMIQKHLPEGMYSMERL